MICTSCKAKQATVFYKETVNGKTKELALCPECAAKLGIGAMATGFFEEDPLASFFNSVLVNPHRTPSMVREEKRCEKCGMRFSQIAKAGKLGCPACYEAFAEELAPTVRKLHGSVEPRGRAPRRFGEKHRLEKTLGKLKEDLKKAIEKQEFEVAAKLRDEIRELEGGN